MAYLSREELLARVKERIGEDLSDDAISFVEDITDTYDELYGKDASTEWEEKYNNLDEEWRKRYTERFYSDNTTDKVTEDVKTDGKKRTYEELFEEREG